LFKKFRFVNWLKTLDTQLLAGLFHQGKIVEMKTGEGNVSSDSPCSFKRFKRKRSSCNNDYLAERDQKFMGKVYKGLGLTVGLVKSTSTLNEKE
jgi:preprotein translocase subunit SecA